MNISSQGGEGGDASAVRPICLTGYMGAGKTSVGRLLAAKISRNFLDLDAEIQLRAGKTIRQIFQEHGDSGFRDVERQSLAALLQGSDPSVIALGGGTLQDETNRNALHAANAFLIHLEAPVGELWRRCTDGFNAEEIAKRPLLAEGEAAFKERSASREANYRSAQVSITTTGLSVEEVAQACQNAISAILQH